MNPSRLSSVMGLNSRLDILALVSIQSKRRKTRNSGPWSRQRETTPLSFPTMHVNPQIIKGKTVELEFQRDVTVSRKRNLWRAIIFHILNGHGILLLLLAHAAIHPDLVNLYFPCLVTCLDTACISQAEENNSLLPSIKIFPRLLGRWPSG